MKKSDWALIILVVVGTAFASWFVIGSVLPYPNEESAETVKTAPLITADIVAPENNVILYDNERPSWCPKDSNGTGEGENNSASSDEEQPKDNESGSDGEENTNTPENPSDRQYINSVFNVCGINSSFTTSTE